MRRALLLALLVAGALSSQTAPVITQAQVDTAVAAIMAGATQATTVLQAGFNQQVAQVATLTTQVATLQSQVTSLQAQVAMLNQINGVCPTCANQLLQGLNTLGAAKAEAVLICCGPATVPPTTPGTQLIALQAAP